MYQERSVLYYKQKNDDYVFKKNVFIAINKNVKTKNYLSFFL